MEAYDKLLKGYKEFRASYLLEKSEEYRQHAAKYQNPKVMVIACSDSRINPAILTHSGLGEIFMVSNVANIVPPYKPEKNSHHSTSSAIEFAVNSLKIKHIIIMGHSGCGGVNALFHKHDGGIDTEEYSFIAPWVNILVGARESVQKEMAHLPVEEQIHACEQRSVLISLENLRSFPFVQRAIENHHLSLHAWYFDIGESALYQHNEQTGKFEITI